MSKGDIFAYVLTKDDIDRAEKLTPVLVYRLNPDTLKLELVKRTNNDESIIYDCNKVSNRYSNKSVIDHFELLDVLPTDLIIHR